MMDPKDKAAVEAAVLTDLADAIKAEEGSVPHMFAGMVRGFEAALRKRADALAAALVLLFVLGGCAMFSTPGKVTSADFTSEAGGVYLHIMQPTNGVGCPSAIAGGAQSMGSIDATCTNNGQTQTIHATAPDPNPALTTAYAGINQQMQTTAAIIQSLLSAVGGAGAKVATGGIAAAPGASSAPLALNAMRRPLVVPPNQNCPAGTLPVTVSGAGTTCE